MGCDQQDSKSCDDFLFSYRMPLEKIPWGTVGIFAVVLQLIVVPIIPQNRGKRMIFCAPKGFTVT